MRKRRLAVLLLLGLVMSLAVNAARGEDAPAEPVQPLTLDDVRDLRQDKKSNAEIIEAAKERGLAFEVDNKMLLHLKRMRFSDEDIESLKAIAAAPAKAAGDQAADQAGDKKERAVNPNAR